MKIGEYHLWHHFGQQQEVLDKGPQLLVRGSGMTVWDAQGRELLDFNAGQWVIGAGHGRQEIIDRMAAQLQQMHFFPCIGRFAVPVQVELASRLAGILPGDLNQCFFSCNGSDATENALKIALLYHQRQGEPQRLKVISRLGEYHGGHLLTLSTCGMPPLRAGFEAVLRPEFVQVPPPYCYRCPWDLTYPSCRVRCQDVFEETILEQGPETVAAVIIEPIMSSAGTIMPPDASYFRRLREVCDKYGIVLIYDEVVSGFGRTGRLFASQHWPDALPDIVCLAKAITSGYSPLACTVVSERIAEAFLGTTEEAYFHGITYGAHPASCAAALANIDILERESLPENAAAMGNYLEEQLSSALGGLEIVGDVRVKGLLVALELVEDCSSREPLQIGEEVMAHCYERGLLLRGVWNLIIISPPLIVSHQQVDAGIDVLRAVLQEVQEKRSAG